MRILILKRDSPYYLRTLSGGTSVTLEGIEDRDGNTYALDDFAICNIDMEIWTAEKGCRNWPDAQGCKDHLYNLKYYCEVKGLNYEEIKINVTSKLLKNRS